MLKGEGLELGLDGARQKIFFFHLGEWAEQDGSGHEGNLTENYSAKHAKPAGVVGFLQS